MIAETAVAAALVHVVDKIDVPAVRRDLGVLDDVEERHSPLNPRVWLGRIQIRSVAREPENPGAFCFAMLPNLRLTKNRFVIRSYIQRVRAARGRT